MKPRARRKKLLDKLAYQYGVRPWMIVVILVLVLSSGALIYWINRASGVFVPVPGGIDVPVSPTR